MPLPVFSQLFPFTKRNRRDPAVVAPVFFRSCFPLQVAYSSTGLPAAAIPFRRYFLHRTLFPFQVCPFRAGPFRGLKAADRVSTDTRAPAAPLPLGKTEKIKTFRRDTRAPDAAVSFRLLSTGPFFPCARFPYARRRFFYFRRPVFSYCSLFQAFFLLLCFYRKEC